jgi:hypothetical protein
MRNALGSLQTHFSSEKHVAILMKWNIKDPNISALLQVGSRNSYSHWLVTILAIFIYGIGRVAIFS